MSRWWMFLGLIGVVAFMHSHDAFGAISPQLQRGTMKSLHSGLQQQGMAGTITESSRSKNEIDDIIRNKIGLPQQNKYTDQAGMEYKISIPAHRDITIGLISLQIQSAYNRTKITAALVRCKHYFPKSEILTFFEFFEFSDSLVILFTSRVRDRLAIDLIKRVKGSLSPSSGSTTY